MLCLEVDENQQKSILSLMKIIDMMIYLWVLAVSIYLEDIIHIDTLINMIRVRIRFFHNRMDALTLLIHKHIKRVESEENNGLVEVYHLLYDKN